MKLRNYFRWCSMTAIGKATRLSQNPQQTSPAGRSTQTYIMVACKRAIVFVVEEVETYSRLRVHLPLNHSAPASFSDVCYSFCLNITRRCLQSPLSNLYQSQLSMLCFTRLWIQIASRAMYERFSCKLLWAFKTNPSHSWKSITAFSSAPVPYSWWEIAIWRLMREQQEI